MLIKSCRLDSLATAQPRVTILTPRIVIAASEHSLVLKEIDVPLWNHDNCNGALQAQFGPAYTLPSTTLCAGAEGRDACDVSISFYRTRSPESSPKEMALSFSKQLFMVKLCFLFRNEGRR